MTHRLARRLMPFLILLPAAAWAQAPSADQLQKQLDDANSQLKAAQDRKNELAQENQKLQKQLDDLRVRGEQTRQRLETIENRTYYMREHYAAWQLFVEANPALRAMWVAHFNGGGDLSSRAAELIGDGRWPFGVEEEPISLLSGIEN